MPLLELRGLSYRYGKKAALQNVTLSVEPGRFVGLLGPNGSGKTTLIKILAGLLPAPQGMAAIGGYRPGLETKRLVSYLPDRRNLPDWLNVRDAAALYADFFADFDRDRALALIDTLNLPHKAAIRTLSKGMAEKLQLALTVSRRAKLYVLDEPIAGVDPAARDLIISTILNNYDPEASVIMSTHLIGDVEPIFDDVIFLNDGEVHTFDSADNLRETHGKSIDQLFREVFAC
jgi:ABC-2 type transport system ATP-binding protein